MEYIFILSICMRIYTFYNIVFSVTFKLLKVSLLKKKKKILISFFFTKKILLTQNF